MRTFEHKTAMRALVRVVFGACVALLITLFARDATAYTWMVRHGYTGCAPCHLDPSGGSVLTPYGRSVGGLVLTTDYVDRGEDPPDEASAVHDFAFGLVTLPDDVMLGGDVRALWYVSKLEGVKTQRELILMQADLAAGLSFSGVLASGSLGYASQGAFPAAVTRGEEDNLVSRHHWLGYELSQSQNLIVRAGRMNLPFGIRSIEHTLWTRERTGTTIESDQQHGVAVSWSPGWFRAELMGIAGNYQIRPDIYRERGYSGYFEWLPTTSLGVGVSSLLTYRKVDEVFLKETWRHAHGAFVRWATPFEPVVLLAEGDYVLRSAKQEFHRKGFTGYIQADAEVIPGMHLIATGETHEVGVYGTTPSFGAWLSFHWFMLPHADIRIDNVYQRFGDELGHTDSLTLLLQGHFYL
jgi:hypothetical protein